MACYLLLATRFSLFAHTRHAKRGGYTALLLCPVGSERRKANGEQQTATGAACGLLLAARYSLFAHTWHAKRGRYTALLLCPVGSERRTANSQQRGSLLAVRYSHIHGVLCWHIHGAALTSCRQRTANSQQRGSLLAVRYSHIHGVLCWHIHGAALTSCRQRTANSEQPTANSEQHLLSLLFPIFIILLDPVQPLFVLRAQ